MYNLLYMMIIDSGFRHRKEIAALADKFTTPPGMDREQTAVELTRFLIHKHYRENNAAADESIFDEPFFWFGAAEQEFSISREAVIDLFHQFVGKVPKCNLTDEDFHAAMIAPDVCMVAGRLWVSTDPSTDIFLRVHQRISACVRWRDGKPRLCMFHLSNPYVEMSKDDVGFPTEMAQQSRDYMRQQIEKQKAEIVRQAAELTDIYNTVSCGILRLMRTPDGVYHLMTFNPTMAQLMDRPEEDVAAMDWSQGFGDDVSSEDRAVLRKCLDKLEKHGDHSEVDYQICTGKGRTVYLHSSNDYISREPEGDIIQRLAYDVTQRVRLEQTLKRLSFEDTLTGLYNRNHFKQIEARLMQEPPVRLGVAYIDLNGLKEWNDRYGHLAGDDLLRRTAAQIASVFKSESHRMGGDEFLILDTERSEKDFEAAISQVADALKEERISAAVGISWRENGCDIRTQMEEADRRMYEQKLYYYSKLEEDSGGV